MTATHRATPAPRFGGESRWTDLGGPVHYLDYGGPADAPVIVAVHGLEGSAVNWSALAPLLTDRYRVLAPDLAGHGFTRSAGRGVDVASNRALLSRFIQEVAGPPVILMGNSMGGMISLSEAAAAPRSVAGLILLDPVVPFGPVRPDPAVLMMFLVNMVPGLGQRMISRRRRFAPEELVAGVLATVCADPSRISPDVVEQHVEVARGGSATPRRTANSPWRPAPSCPRPPTSPAAATGARSTRSAARCWSCTACSTGWFRSRRSGGRPAPTRPGHWSCSRA